MNGPVIYGLPTSAKLGLVNMRCEIKSSQQHFAELEDLKRQYPDQFKGIGKFKRQYQLTLVKSTKQVIHPPQKTPILLSEPHPQKKIQSEVKKMVDLDGIQLVHELTDWVSSITYVTKADGSLRICLDPRDVNWHWNKVNITHQPLRSYHISSPALPCLVN